MRQFLFAWVAVATLACGSTSSTLGSTNRKVGDAGLGAGGTGTGGRDTGGAAGQGNGGVQTGCRSDIECKGSRICVNGQCVDPPGTGGFRGTGGFPPFGGAGGAGGFVFGGAGGVVPDASVGAQPGTGGVACAAVKQTPESVVVYRDAMVTDTIYTSKPVALFFMLDRSTSMVTPSSTNWDNATAAISAFVSDPLLTGVDVGLGTFPFGPSNTADCAAGSDCGTQVVRIAPLPGNANAMIQALQAQRPSTSSFAGTPTECGLRGMINQCLSFMAQSSIGEQCVSVLITDGEPTQCNLDQAALNAIAADGRSKGAPTFAIGLAGSNLVALNALAIAGGSSKAFDVSAGVPAFIQALNDIRKTVTVSITTTVTTPGVVATPVACQWMLPPGPGGQPVDPSKVNVEIVVPGGSSGPGYVASSAQCSRFGEAWYYDDAQNPTRVVLCPEACSRLTGAPQASVNLLFGCETFRAM